ncbi:MAG TPA: hypothetical protein ENN30_00365 [Candidatus Woesearchaeota archaeon]|nr:hypothetical protein [Candidatus Woesearchaeota archaeon]
MKGLKKDRFVQQNLPRYVNVIKALIELGRAYQSEKLGDFFVSPRGNTKIRVAWYQQGEFLIIYDFLYESGKGRYVDDWADKARLGKIKRKNYAVKKPLSDVFAPSGFI